MREQPSQRGGHVSNHGDDACPGATPPAQVTRLFTYDRRLPLALTRLGSNTGRLSAQALAGVTVEAITYASPEGGEVPALVVIPKGRGPFPGVIVQHDLPSTKEAFLPAGVDLARNGAVAVLIDAPFNRPSTAASAATSASPQGP